MLLKRLFKPKWRKDSDPAQPAGNAADPGARRQACKSLTDLARLQKVATEDDDASVRDFAAARLRKLLSGSEPGGPGTDAGIEHLRRCGDGILAAHLAQHAIDPQLRLAALALTDAPDILCLCALNDEVAAVRLAAAQRLDDKTALERLVRQIGRKDKKVLRQARSSLKAIAEREQAPERLRAQAQELCERVERLGRHATWGQDKALLEHTEQQWAALEGQLPDDLARRYLQARDRFLQVHTQEREQELAQEQMHQAQRQLDADKRSLIAELTALEPGADAVAASEADLLKRWATLDELPATLETRRQRAWEQTLEHLHSGLAERQRLLEREQRLSALCTEARTWMAQSRPLVNKALKRWLRQGRPLADLVPEDNSARLFHAAEQGLRERLAKQRAHALQKHEKLPERLTQLEQALDQGSLKPATSLYQSIHSDLELCKISDLPGAGDNDLEQRLHRLTPRLRELQNWRKWGTDQHREELVRAMQELQSADLALYTIVERVRDLQTQWKTLDRGGSPVNETLWKHFHQAADAAFERCKPYLEEQAQQRRANRQAREDLCTRLEDFLDQVDWERMDWKKAVRAEREIRTGWSRIGPADPRHQKALDKRYHKAMKRLDQHLARERAANKALKTSLIEQAQALVEEPDLEQAIDAIKHLQRQWHTTVASRRKQENQLWQRFRTACDQVFERRSQVRDAQLHELRANAQARSTLCEELEALAATAPEAAPENWRHRMHKLQGRWEEGARVEVQRKDAERLNRRWRTGMQALQQHIEQLEGAADRARMQLLAQAADLCRELETGLEASDPQVPEVEAWKQRWDALQLAPETSGAAGIRRRFDTALKARADTGTRVDWIAGLSDNVRRRADLCLRMEVLAGIESPPEVAQERLALQVSRLAEHLGEGETAPLDSASRMELEWYRCGPAPAAQAPDLEARFRRALQASLPAAPQVSDERLADSA